MMSQIAKDSWAASKLCFVLPFVSARIPTHWFNPQPLDLLFDKLSSKQVERGRYC